MKKCGRSVTIVSVLHGYSMQKVARFHFAQNDS